MAFFCGLSCSLSFVSWLFNKFKFVSMMNFISQFLCMNIYASIHKIRHII